MTRRDDNPAPRPAVTARSVIVALLLVPVLCALTQLSDTRAGATPMAGGFPPLAASLLLFALIAWNALAKRTARSLALSRAETLFIYAVLFVVNGIPARGLAYFLLGNITAFRYYATPANAWDELFAHYVPSWVSPADPRVIEGLYEGARGVSIVPWAPWLAPMLTWAWLAMSMSICVLAVSALFERQWIRNERLGFPLVAVPLALTGSEGAGIGTGAGGPTWRRSVFWIGVTVPVILHSINGLHNYIPAVPLIKLHNNILDAHFVAQPWRSMGFWRISIYPIVVGLIFLVPSEVSFSCWVFFLFSKAQRIIGRATGLNALRHGAHAGWPFPSPQGQGAYLALMGLFLWAGRSHFRHAWRTAWGRDGETDGAALAYRTAFAGLFLGMLSIAIWSRLTGLSAAYGVGFFTLYLVYCLALTRLVAEGGLPWPLGPLGPEHLMLSFLGSRSVPPRILTISALQYQHVREYRQLLMPAVMQGLKLRGVLGDRGRAWMPIFLGALLLSVAISLPLMLRLTYPEGGLQAAGSAEWAFKGFAREAFNRLGSYLVQPLGTSYHALGAIAVGAVVTLALGALRFRFMWWPLHPLGYVFSGTMQQWLYAHMWFSIVLGWLFKVILVRYGGAKITQRARPLFLGLIVGDLLSGGLWALIDSIGGNRWYFIWAV